MRPHTRSSAGASTSGPDGRTAVGAHQEVLLDGRAGQRVEPAVDVVSRAGSGRGARSGCSSKSFRSGLGQGAPQLHLGAVQAGAHGVLADAQQPTRLAGGEPVEHTGLDDRAELRRETSNAPARSPYSTPSRTCSSAAGHDRLHGRPRPSRAAAGRRGACAGGWRACGRRCPRARPPPPRRPASPRFLPAATKVSWRTSCTISRSLQRRISLAYSHGECRSYTRAGPWRPRRLTRRTSVASSRRRAGLPS